MTEQRFLIQTTSCFAAMLVSLGLSVFGGCGNSPQTADRGGKATAQGDAESSTTRDRQNPVASNGSESSEETVETPNSRVSEEKVAEPAESLSTTVTIAPAVPVEPSAGTSPAAVTPTPDSPKSPPVGDEDPSNPTPQPLPSEGIPENPAVPAPVAPKRSDSVPTPAQPKAAPARPIAIELSQPLHEPVVVLSSAHAATNKVGVGDAMPAIALPDLGGQVHKLSDLYGERATVVVFWSAGRLFAEEQFARLNAEVVEPFQAAGVRVIAINVGDPVNEVQALAKQHAVKATTLLDETGEAFAQVASAHLPRTYVLDAEGKIIWLDLEYSRITRRELRNAIVHQLKQNGLLKQGGG
ncbi:MAG: redoxin domain-containing protein [Planctomycetales bacterium]|nr:redoxin domain-containing protein [Planctomycetales bacterium]